jgi:hypothetical protein
MNDALGQSSLKLESAKANSALEGIDGLRTPMSRPARHALRTGLGATMRTPSNTLIFALILFAGLRRPWLKVSYLDYATN